MLAREIKILCTGQKGMLYIRCITSVQKGVKREDDAKITQDTE